jgi:hypothetical protein
VKIVIEGVEFNKSDITQLYPAAMIPTGEGDELTPISLEWYESQDKSDIKAIKFGIFVHLRDKSVHPFFYETRESLEDALSKLLN